MATNRIVVVVLADPGGARVRRTKPGTTLAGKGRNRAAIPGALHQAAWGDARKSARSWSLLGKLPLTEVPEVGALAGRNATVMRSKNSSSTMKRARRIQDLLLLPEHQQGTGGHPRTGMAAITRLAGRRNCSRSGTCRRHRDRRWRSAATWCWRLTCLLRRTERARAGQAVGKRRADGRLPRASSTWVGRTLWG